MSVDLVYETHSTTIDNENGVATGWSPGELSSAGRAEAARLGERRHDADLVVCSDLARAVETMQVAFAGTDIPRRTDVRLRECDYGELTGVATVELARLRGEYVDTPFPGGQSWSQVTDGVDELLGDLLGDHDGKRVLLIGHSATRFALDHLLTGRPLLSAVTGPFAWRPGWSYLLDVQRPAVRVLDGPAAVEAVERLAAVYRAAFGAPGYDETEDNVAHFRDDQLLRHATYDGFRASTLEVGDELAGFAYGYTGTRGQWWSDQMVRRAPREVTDAWVGGHFELVEIAVDPRWQNRGFATALHDHLLLGLPHERALLTTYAADRAAPRLYARLGWDRLATEVFEGSDLWGRRLSPVGRGSR